MNRKFLLNLHGFLSSAQSEKSQSMAAYLKRHHTDIEYHSPQLADNPGKAYAEVEALLLENMSLNNQIGVVGHSLGGYFATHLSQKYDFKVVLVNPLVHAYEIMCEYFGPRHNPHTDAEFEISEGDISFLISINLEEIVSPKNFLLLQQLGDEITEPQEAVDFYAQCAQIVEDGGNHDFEGYERHFPRIVEFLF